MFSPGDIIVLCPESNALNNFIVGVFVEQIAGTHIKLEDPVHCKLIEDEEQGHRAYIQPMKLLSVLVTDIANYAGAGLLQEPYARDYRNWRKNHDQHQDLFDTEDTEDPDPGSDDPLATETPTKDISPPG